MNDSSSFTNDTLAMDGNKDELYYSCPLLGKKNALGNAAKITAFVVIIAMSLLGNVLIITVTRRTRHMQTIAYNFIVNMAIADLCTTIINMPESLAVEIVDTDEWIPGVVGVVLCKLLPFCQQVCTFCSILSLLTIALDRFFAICHPLKRIMSQKGCKIIIAGTWLIPCISSAPLLLANNVIKIDGLLLCLEEWPSPLNSMATSRDYTIVLFVLFYLLPLIIISALYSFVIYTLWKRKHPGNFSSKTDRIHSRSKTKALKMFITIVICFALCWLPYHVTSILVAYDKEFYNCGFPENVDFITFFLLHALSAFNPCICVVFNKDYRHGFKRALTTSCKS